MFVERNQSLLSFHKIFNVMIVFFSPRILRFYLFGFISKKKNQGVLIEKKTKLLLRITFMYNYCVIIYLSLVDTFAR